MRHGQRISRATILITMGMVGILAISGDPRAALTLPAFWALCLPAIGWTLLESLVLKTDEPPAYRGRLTTRLLQAAVMIGMYVSALDYFHLAPGPIPRTTVVALSGAGLVVAGALVRILAIRTLDRHFRYELRVEGGQTLVSRGPYRVVRHPSYLGIVLITAGGALAFSSVWGLLAGVGLTLGVFVHRIREEEAVLTDAFGDEYRAYAKRTWRMLPPIY